MSALAAEPAPVVNDQYGVAVGASLEAYAANVAIETGFNPFLLSGM